MTQTTEIAPDIFRICTYFPEWKLQFDQFLVRDNEPLLYHTGLRMRRLLWLFLLLISAASACAMDRADFTDSGWRSATHVVVVSEGDVIDGEVTVVESWRGDLAEGMSLRLPWLARFADRETRRVDVWPPSSSETEARYLPCDRMLVLLLRVEEQPAGIAAWRPAGSQALSNAWISEGTVYAYISNGSSMGLRRYRTEPELKKMLADHWERQLLQREAFDDAMETLQEARNADCASKVELLREAARSRSAVARDIALSELVNSGNAGVDMLITIYEDTDLSPQEKSDAVEAIARTGGSRAGPVLLDILRRERESSSGLAYSAAQSLLRLRYRPAMDDVAAFVESQPEDTWLHRQFVRVRHELSGEPDPNDYPSRVQRTVPMTEDERLLAGYSDKTPEYLIPLAGFPDPHAVVNRQGIETQIMPVLEAALSDSPEVREKAVAELIALRALVSEKLSEIARDPEARGRSDALAVMGEIGVVDESLWGTGDEFGRERPEWRESWRKARTRARLGHLRWGRAAVVQPDCTTSLDRYPALEQAVENLQSPKVEANWAGKITLMHWYYLVCMNLYRRMPYHGATEATPAHATAAFLLGEYRAWAEQRLFSNIDMRDPNGTCDGYPRTMVVQTTESDYPCFVALLKLGGRVDERKRLDLLAGTASLVTRERVARYLASAGGTSDYQNRIRSLLGEVEMLRSVEPIMLHR